MHMFNHMQNKNFIFVDIAHKYCHCDGRTLVTKLIIYPMLAYIEHNSIAYIQNVSIIE